MTHKRSIAVENIVWKGEIACNKQFLLFSQCFLSYIALIFHFKCTKTHYQTTNFRFFQTERVCRQFQIWRKWKNGIQTGRKHRGKRRNCLLRAISPFPTVFQKACFPEAWEGVIVWEWVKMWSAICFNLDQSKILSSGNGLRNLLDKVVKCQKGKPYKSDG